MCRADQGSRPASGGSSSRARTRWSRSPPTCKRSSNAWASRLPRPLSLAEVFERSLEVLGAERILYGSDSSFFPRGWQKDQFETQVGVLETLGVTEDQAAGILGGNLTRLVS